MEGPILHSAKPSIAPSSEYIIIGEKSMKHRPKIVNSGCQVVTAEFAWWSQTCNQVATRQLEDEYGDPHPICDEHYQLAEQLDKEMTDGRSR